LGPDILNVDCRYFSLALILGGDFFTGSVLSTALTKLVLRFIEKTKDQVASNTLRAEVRLLPIFRSLFPEILTKFGF
jgi:hypothetical protein